jgi:hypothetical protein
MLNKGERERVVNGEVYWALQGDPISFVQQSFLGCAGQMQNTVNV